MCDTCDIWVVIDRSRYSGRYCTTHLIGYAFLMCSIHNVKSALILVFDPVTDKSNETVIGIEAFLEPYL